LSFHSRFHICISFNEDSVIVPTSRAACSL
jgi:hypothetical protein